MQLVAVWVAVTHVQTLYSAFLSLSHKDTRSHTHTHAHTGCQSCSFSASHIILYKSYINASSTAFFFWGGEPLSHTPPESHYTGQTYLHTPIDILYNQAA